MLNIQDPLTAYQVDAAVTTFRVIIKNALLETVEVGSGPARTRRPRYTLSELLDDKFKLPRKDEQASVSTLEGVEGAHYDEVN